MGKCKLILAGFYYCTFVRDLARDWNCYLTWSVYASIKLLYFYFVREKRFYPASNNNFPGKIGSFNLSRKNELVLWVCWLDASLSSTSEKSTSDTARKRDYNTSFVRTVTPYFTLSLVAASHEIFRSLFIRSGLLLYTMSYGWVCFPFSVLNGWALS